MPTTTAVIGAAEGLHARPAALFVQAAVATGLPVTIGRPDADPVDARSILAVMGLGARQGERVSLSADGPDADAALTLLTTLLEEDVDAQSRHAGDSTP